MYLFTTSERDNDTVTKDSGKYFTKRYGLPVTEITEGQARNIAWMELNRRGRFEHLVDRSTAIPTLTNKEAQIYLVDIAITKGIH